MSTTSAPNAATAQARVIADELARGGVRHVVVCPGSRSAALAIAVDAEPRLAVHVHPDERSAAFVALGIGRATGVPAAVVVTSGTAVANLLPAAVEADHAGVPLLLLTADRPPELRDTGANQTIDQRGLLGPVRWEVELPVAEDRPDAVRTWRAVAARAIAVARGDGGSMPGPVHVDVPTREPTVPVPDDGRTTAPEFVTPLDGRPAGAPWLRVGAGPRVADAPTIERLVARFAGVERGLIVVGAPVGGVTVPAAATDALSEATGWPVVAEVLAPARWGRATLVAGSWLLSDPDLLSRLRPDVVLRVGRPTLHAAWGRWEAGSADVMLVDAHGGVHDPTRSLGELVVADPSLLLGELAARLGGAGPSAWSAAWRDADRRATAAVAGALGDGPLTGLHVARSVAGSVPAGTPLVVASSLPVRDLDLVAPTVRALDVHANRGAAGIDGTVGTALGVGLGAGAGVWALLGDLALLHDANGLLLQPEDHPVPPTLVVVDNGGGRIFDGLPPARWAPTYERLFAAPPGRDLTVLARLHGLEPVEVTEAAGLAALTTAEPGTLWVATVDPQQDRSVRASVRSAVATAVAEGAA